MELAPAPSSSGGAVVFIIGAIGLLWVWAFVRAPELAHEKRRNPRTWRIVAVAIGPASVAVLSFLPAMRPREDSSWPDDDTMT